MSPFLRKLLGMNWVIVALVTTLSLFGIVAIYSATYFRTGEYWEKQVIWTALGLVVFIMTSVIHYRWVKIAAIPLFLSSIVLIALTYSPLGQEVGGAKCWLRLPGVGTFQPSQMGVIFGIITVSLFLVHFRNRDPLIHIAGTALIVAIPMGLIIKQPDMGMTLVWVPSILAVLLAAGIPKRHFILIMLSGLLALPVVLNFLLKPYQRARITAFINPDADQLGAAWAVNQALIAIGSGGLSGKGFKATGTQVEQGFIPGTTVHTDYIFTAIGEQWGFIGACILIAAFGLLLLSCLFTAHQSADELGLIMSVGFAAQMFFHVFQNIGMTIALVPITGLPLPFISYGGTFLIMVMFAMGLINSVWVHRRDPEI
jgi:rod shape determining protein RodA